MHSLRWSFLWSFLSSEWLRVKDERQLLKAVWAFKLTELVEFPKNVVQTPNPLKSTWAALTSPLFMLSCKQCVCAQACVCMHEFALHAYAWLQSGARVQSPKQRWIAAYHGVTLLLPPSFKVAAAEQKALFIPHPSLNTVFTVTRWPEELAGTCWLCNGSVKSVECVEDGEFFQCSLMPYDY